MKDTQERDISILRSAQFGEDIREFVTSLDLQSLADAINGLGRGEYAEAEHLLSAMPHTGAVKKVCLELEVSHGEELSLSDGIRVRFDGLTVGCATACIEKFPVTAQDVRVALLSSANAQDDYRSDFVA